MSEVTGYGGFAHRSESDGRGQRVGTSPEGTLERSAPR